MYHIKTCHSLILFYIIFFSLFISQQTFAEEIIPDESLHKTMVKTKPINQGGYIFDIQKVDPELLAEDVEQLRYDYIRHQHELEQQVEDKKLKTGDVIITIIVPGGLLYAGYRKHEFEQAKSDLSDVTSEIKELSNDLIALYSQQTIDPLMLAQLP